MSYRLCVMYVGCVPGVRNSILGHVQLFVTPLTLPLNPWLSVVVCALVKYQLCATLKLFDKKS